MTPLFSQKHLPVWAGLLGALAVYAPAFCVVFGMHSDAVFIPMTFAQRDIFFESRQLLAVGRPLLTALLTLTGWLIHRTEDLAVGRLAAWAGLMLWTGALLRFLARRYRVEAFWRGIIGAAVVLLPSSQLFVLWVIQAVQGLSTITLALGAYVLLDRGRPGPRLVAAVLFLAALFIYQPTAMMVFTLTAAGVFFSPLSSCRLSAAASRGMSCFSADSWRFILSLSSVSDGCQARAGPMRWRLRRILPGRRLWSGRRPRPRGQGWDMWFTDSAGRGFRWRFCRRRDY